MTGSITIPEYCELKELPYERTYLWIAVLKKERNTINDFLSQNLFYLL